MTRPYISSGFALYAGTLVILAGCTDPAPGVDASTADAPVSADAPVATDASASQLVGPSGGVIFVAGLTLTIPPGAVAAPVAITVTRTDLPAPAGYVGYSPVWRFAPEGLTFARPVTVDLTFNGDAARAGLYWSSAGGYERLTASIAGDRVVGSTSHFSLGFVGDLLALDAGLSDAATDQPADVLPDASAPPDGSALDGGTPSDGGATVDAPDVPTTPAVAAPRPIAPLTGSHVPSRRPMLRWALPAGVMTARVTLCRDRALTASCVSFDAAGTTGAPAADLAPGIWYWALRGVVGGAAGGSLGPVWRLRVATATVAGARPWGSDLDVNGDGFADVLAGVRDLAVSVFPGGVAGPSTTPVVRVAPLDSTHFGQAVDVAGDVNGDGYGDFVVGSPGSNAFYVYLGSATGPAATPSVVTGPVGSGLGSSVTGAGDVNGDGFDDVVAVNPSGNAVWLLPGGASGPGTPTRVTVAATSTASVVSGAGDVDGDGYADVLLAGTANVSGQLLRGAATGLDAARAVAVDRTSAPAGDVNGDGRGDLAFSDAAGARLVLGAATINPAGSAVGGTSPARVVAAPRGGDFNGDGYDDLLLVDPGAGFSAVAPGGAAGPGPAAALASGFGSATLQNLVGAGDVDGDGADDALSHRDGLVDLYVTRGSSAGLTFGRLSYLRLGAYFNDPNQYATVGDVNGDGRADFAYGRSVHLGTASGLSLTASWTLPSGDVYFVTGLGDINRDGYTDVAMMLRDRFTLIYPTSAVLGSSSGPGTVVPRVAGNSVIFEGSPYRGISRAGDVNRDGFDDFLTGSRGGARVSYGRSPLTTPLAGADIVVPGFTDMSDVAEAGDVNHDGFADVVVGSSSGGYRVVAGAATGTGAVLGTFPSGNAIPIAVGDVNGDLFDDLAVVTSAGIQVRLGSASGVVATPAQTLTGGRVYAAGDVNHDGRPDVIVMDIDRLGRAGLFLGNGSGFAPVPHLIAPDFIGIVGTNGRRGHGDIDGDGFDDVVLPVAFGVAVQRFDVPGPRPVVLTLTGSDTAASAFR